MKKNLCFKVTLITILMLFCIFSFQVLASDVAPISADTNSIDDEQINDIIATYQTEYEFASSDLYLFDQNVEVSQTVDGNVFAYGSTVNITGEIYGDLFVIADSLNISDSAVVYGNVFAYSTNITVDGIASDVYAMSSNFNLSDDGMLARNLYLSSNSTTLTGHIARDVYVSTGSLSFGEATETVIDGNLNYTSPSSIEISDGLIGGEINFTSTQIDTGSIVASIINNVLMALLFSLVVILLAMWITPKFKDRASEILSKSGFKAFGIGILVFVVTIIAAFIFVVFTSGLCFSIALALIALLILAYSISNTIFSMAVSKLITQKLNLNKNVAYVLFSLLIVLVITLIRYIPYIGGFITFITSIIGLGILAVNAYKRKDLVNANNTIETKE